MLATNLNEELNQHCLRRFEKGDKALFSMLRRDTEGNAIDWAHFSLTKTELSRNLILQVERRAL